MFIYNLLVRAYGWLIHLAAIRNAKAKQWVAGRCNWRSRLAAEIGKLPAGPRIWVHCASYGEFEQGRPLIEAIKKQRPEVRIILSFFSPSGYEPFKDWQGADIICYMPLDTPRNARDFIARVKPDKALFIKYEFWINHLFSLRAEAIPTFLISAVFKPHHPFFKWYGAIFRRSLLTFERLFVQDESSAMLLKSIGFSRCEVCGDTRFDRVLEIKAQFKPLPLFEDFCRGHRICVAGSTWPGDEALLVAAYKKLEDKDLKLIMAPHNVDEKHVKGLKQLLEKNELPYAQYSNGAADPSARVLIVDAIGLLSRLYHYADVAYVGGGFDSGIHNCLEPSVFGKPVLFYDHDYEKYLEVVELVRLGTAMAVEGTDSLASGLDQFLHHADPDLQNILDQYFESRSGVTLKVLQAINLGSLPS